MKSFDLGQVVATPGALAALTKANQPFHEFLVRHARGDWGDVCVEDWEANDLALKDGGRLLSAYKTGSGEVIWVVTEAEGEGGKRPVTTILLPEEY